MKTPDLVAYHLEKLIIEINIAIAEGKDKGNYFNTAYTRATMLAWILDGEIIHGQCQQTGQRGIGFARKGKNHDAKKL